MHGVPRINRREPVFNLPRVVVWTVLALVAVHLGRLLLSDRQDDALLLQLAFIPARYGGDARALLVFGAADPARWWTPFTYALLHGGAEHLIVNVLWLVVFGSAVAWRFGSARFLLFFLFATAAGAGAHTVAHPGEYGPVVGASAGISGLTAAAARFIFEAGGPLDGMRDPSHAAFRAPASPLYLAIRQGRVLAFLGAWFALTLLLGTGAVPIGPAEGSPIAWEAHIGGFVAGLVLFPLFDPVPARQRGGDR